MTIKQKGLQNYTLIYKESREKLRNAKQKNKDMQASQDKYKMKSKVLKEQLQKSEKEF
jgi:hypothetical protein